MQKIETTIKAWTTMFPEIYTYVEQLSVDKGIRIQDKQPEISEFMAELRETYSELEHTYAVINRLKVTFVKV